MRNGSRVWFFASWVLLPALLFLLSIFLTGAYFETNDDAVMVLLLRGVLAAEPVTDLQFYLHGLSNLLVWLYKVAPSQPWYGLALYFLLFAASCLAAVFLAHAARERNVALWQVLLPASVIYLGAWIEHTMWFSFVRVAVVLAGAAVLAYSMRPLHERRRWAWLVVCGACFVLALCVRPRAAFMGAMLALPVLWWLQPRRTSRLLRTLRTVAPFAVLALLFQLYLLLAISPVETRYRHINREKSNLNDYQLYRPAPDTYADSLAIAAVQNWLLADREIINAGLFQRAGGYDAGYFLSEVAPKKAAELLPALLRDYFLLIFLQGLLVAALITKNPSVPNRRLLLVWQVGFWVVLLAMGIVLKLPPRLAASMLSVHMLALTGVWLRYGNRNLQHARLPFALLVGLCVVQVYKIGHRMILQQQAQIKHEQIIAQLGVAFKHKVLITAQMGEQLTSLSPFRNYSFGTNKVVRITGWPTLLMAYPAYLTKLTGEPTFATAIDSLAAAPQAVWLLPQRFAQFLPHYLRELHGTNLVLTPAPETPWLLQKEGFRVYQVKKLPAIEGK